MHKRTAGGYNELTVNPLLKKEEQRGRLNAHHCAILQAKSTINTRNDSFTQQHQLQRNNRKVNRVEEARKKQIAKDNQILVEKMTRTVLRNPSHHNVAQPSALRMRAYSAEAAPTLNYHIRKQERDRILHDNVRIARKLITETKPTLSRSEWQRHSQEHNRLRSSLAKFEEVPLATIHQARSVLSASPRRPVARAPPRRDARDPRDQHTRGAPKTFRSLRSEGAISSLDYSEQSQQPAGGQDAHAVTVQGTSEGDSVPLQS